MKVFSLGNERDQNGLIYNVSFLAQAILWDSGRVVRDTKRAKTTFDAQISTPWSPNATGGWIDQWYTPETKR